MDTKTENEWLMLLKTVPYSIFELFFDDNPELRYLAGDTDEMLYLSPEERAEMQHKINVRRSAALTLQKEPK